MELSLDSEQNNTDVVVLARDRPNGWKRTKNVAFDFLEHFPPIFVLLKVTCLVTLFDRKFQVSKKSPNLTIFGTFNELLATKYVNISRFARNVKMRLFL